MRPLSVVMFLTLALPSFATAVEEADGAAPEAEMSKECIEMRADPYGDVGKILAAGCQPTTGQMSRLMDNPLGSVAMWINQVDLIPLSNDAINPNRTELYTNYMGILQFPKAVTKNWNVINRIIYNIPSTPIDETKAAVALNPPAPLPPGQGPPSPPATVAPINFLGGRTSGYGDMIYLGLLSPKDPIRHGEGQNSVWGFGLGQTFPSASSDLLGSGKWSAGPSAIYAYLGQKWKLGALVQTYFSYAGDAHRADVRTMNIQVFYYYSVTSTFSIGAGPNIIADFEAADGDQWTVPLGIGASYTVNVGKVPFRLAVEYYGSVVRPNSLGNTHDVRFMVIPAVPAGLIPFL